MARMSKKLTDALATATGRAMTEEPVVVIPEVDPIKNLAEMSNKGFDAVAALCAELRDKSELAADLNQRLNLVQARNIELRDELRKEKEENKLLRHFFSRLGSHVGMSRNVFRDIAIDYQRIVSELGQIAPPTPMSNNPKLPPVDAKGLPVDDVPHFTPEGLPANGNGAHVVSQEDLQNLLNKLDA